MPFLMSDENKNEPTGHIFAFDQLYRAASKTEGYTNEHLEESVSLQVEEYLT